MRPLLFRIVLAGCLLMPSFALGRAGPPVAGERPRVDAYGDPLPDEALARFGTARWREGSDGGICLSPDGKLLALFGPNEIRLVDTVTGKVARRIRPEGLVLQPGALAFSPDSRFLSLWDLGDQINLIDVAKGEMVGQLKGPDQFGGGGSISFSRDGKLLAIAGVRSGENPAVILWDTQAKKELKKFIVPHARIVEAVLSPNGKLLATWGDQVRPPNAKRTIQLWDMPSGKELRALPLEGPCQHAVFSPDGKQLVTAEYIATLRFLDVASGKVLRRCAVRRGVNLVQFSPDGKLLATAGVDCTVQLWDGATGRRIGQCPGPPRTQLCSLAFLPGNKVLAAGIAGQAIRLWEVPSGRERTPRGGHDSTVHALAFSRDGKTLLSAADDGVCIWQVASRKQLRRMEPIFDERGIGAGNALLSPCGCFVIWGTHYANGLQVMETKTRKEIAALRGEGFHGIVPAVFAPPGDAFAHLDRELAGKEQRLVVRVWDLAAGLQIRSMRLPGNNTGISLALSPGATTLAVAPQGNGLRGEIGQVTLWEMASGKEIVKLAIRELAGMAFSPDGEMLATSSKGMVHLYDTAHGNRIQGLKMSERFPNVLAFSPDGRTLAVATLSYGKEDCEVLLWELASGKVRAAFPGHRAGTQSLAFSPDGRTLATGGMDTTVMLWDVTGRTGRMRPSKIRPTAAELAGLWADLDRGAVRAHRAMARLMASPADALTLFHRELKPAAGKPPSEKEVQRLIGDLGAESFAEREKANEALANAGQAVRAALVKALAVSPDLEKKRRLEKLLNAMTAGPTREMLRPTRALEVLERLGTPQARHLLRKLAEGNAGAPLTMEAAATLKRLQRKR